MTMYPVQHRKYTALLTRPEPVFSRNDCTEGNLDQARCDSVKGFGSVRITYYHGMLPMIGTLRSLNGNPIAYLYATILSHKYDHNSPHFLLGYICPTPLHSMLQQRISYFSFFLGLNWFVWPHFFLRQLVARGGNRA